MCRRLKEEQERRDRELIKLKRKEYRDLFWKIIDIITTVFTVASVTLLLFFTFAKLAKADYVDYARQAELERRAERARVIRENYYSTIDSNDEYEREEAEELYDREYRALTDPDDNYCDIYTNTCGRV